MRLALHVAVTSHQDLLFLGALGWGVFANPHVDVAQFWLEVLRSRSSRVPNW